jgi:hypothetical protein
MKATISDKSTSSTIKGLYFPPSFTLRARMRLLRTHPSISFELTASLQIVLYARWEKESIG